MIEIRKYSNRRLYDTSTSQYVTLPDVAKMIRDGVELRVVDAKTGEDLTRVVMLQIICESKSEREALPIGFLRQVIQASSKTVRTSIKDFLTAGVSAQKEVQQQVGHWMRLGAMANPLVAPFVTAWEGIAKPGARGEAGTNEAKSPADLEAGQGAPLEEAATSNTSDESSTSDDTSDISSAAPAESGRAQDIELLQAQLAAMQEQIEALQDK